MRRRRLGIVANELFAVDVGRMGGFGWAVQQVSNCFAERPELGVDVTILMGEGWTRAGSPPRRLHGSPVIWPEQRIWRRVRQLKSARLDMLLSIDYRPNYRSVFNSLPRTPILIWARDPWDDDDRDDVASLRIPGQEDARPEGVRGFPTPTLPKVVLQSRLMCRRLLFAVTTPYLARKLKGAYGVAPKRVHVLPNIIDFHGPFKKSERPLVVSLARLDPVKRPWLMVDIARLMPEVDFIFMGQSHFSGRGGWHVPDLPANVRLIGHAGEAEKKELLSSAWLLINTSIHEGLSVSFLEALACETPLVACVNPEDLVSRFGTFVGHHLGTGSDAVPAFVDAIRDLLRDKERRLRLGSEGRDWVNSVHSRQSFLRSFSELATLAGRPLPASGTGNENLSRDPVPEAVE